MNISELNKTGIEQLKIIKERILEHSSILYERQVTGIYFRPSRLMLEVFILVDHTLSEKEAAFWYKFSFVIAKGLDEKTFKIGVGDPRLWESTSKRFGWKRLEIY